MNYEMYFSKTPRSLELEIQYNGEEKCVWYLSTHEYTSTHDDLERSVLENYPHPLKPCMDCNGERVEKGLAHRCYKVIKK